MKSLGRHDSETGYVQQEYLPEKLQGQKFYDPKGHGYEKLYC